MEAGRTGPRYGGGDQTGPGGVPDHLGGDRRRLALRERIESFLAAKRIDGLSQKTLKDYGLVLRSFARYADKPPEEITADDVRRYLAGLSEPGAEGWEHRHPRQHAAELFRMAGAGRRDREKPHAEDQEPERGPGRRPAAP